MKVIIKCLLLVCIALEAHTVMAQRRLLRINALVERATAKFGVPAFAVVTMDTSEILESHTYGVRIWNGKDSINIDNYFHIGSCSKSILAVIAAKLIQEHRISWDTKFFHLYPELVATSLPDYKDITLQDLIVCKAGLKPFTRGDEIFPEIPDSLVNARYEFARWLLTLPPTVKKDNGRFQFQYSNAGYTVASLMLEKVTDMKFENVVEKYITEEMGIEVIWGFPNKTDSHQPWGHTIVGGVYETFPPSHQYELPYLLIPAGDLSMKPLGFAKYVQHHLKGLLGVDHFLNTEHYRYLHYTEKGFSLGVYNTRQFGKNYSGMDGSAGTFFCRAIIIPDEDFAFIIMANAGTGTAYMKAVDWLTAKIAKGRFNWWWKFWM
jgi:CubicO group peptidase (beta-lactamase class C family)